eukprot:scaffold90949_cov60-Phaeocystis_antarctica.AAC.7
MPAHSPQEPLPPPRTLVLRLARDPLMLSPVEKPVTRGRGRSARRGPHDHVLPTSHLRGLLRREL